MLVSLILLFAIGPLPPIVPWQDTAHARPNDFPNGNPDTAVDDDSAIKMRAINPRLPRPLPINEDRVAAHGIQKFTGKHLVLYTDIRQRPDIDELVDVFDLAVPQWCDYFSVDPKRTTSWRMRAFVMKDPARFQSAGLIPDGLPKFPAGYQRGSSIWIYPQPGDYYSRHLLLHEGTHTFMEWFLDGMGAPWYSEGMAERMGLHRWVRPDPSSALPNSPDAETFSPNPPGEFADGAPVTHGLKIGYRIGHADEAPYWGRVKVIREAWANDTALSLGEVLEIPSGSFRDVQYYGWSWAGCEFLGQHELSRSVFADFDRHARLTVDQFNTRVTNDLRPHFQSLSRDWLLFISEIDYGAEVSKTRLIPAQKIGQDTRDSPAAPVFSIRADHGWQATTVEVKRGERWLIQCDSSFQVDQTMVDGIAMPWHCTAHGITLDYYRGRPLGILLAGVHNPAAESSRDEIAGLLSPAPVGKKGILKVESDGVLCLRANGSPARMADRQGVLEVSLKKLE